MILRSYRDVEIEFRKIIQALADLNNLIQSSKSGTGITNADVIALINTYSKRETIINQVENQAPDIELANAGTLIIHKLIHQFLEAVLIKELEAESITVKDLDTESIKFTDPAAPGLLWTFEPDPVNPIIFNITFSDPVSSQVFMMKYYSSIPFANSVIEFNGMLGVNTSRVGLVSTKALSVLPGAAPAVGDVLTALNTAGDVKWAAPATSTSVASASQINASGNLTLTAAAQNYINGGTGAPGTYEITLTANYIIVPNDTEVNAGLMTNNTGSFVLETGQIRVFKDAAGQVIHMATRSWIIVTTVASVALAFQVWKTGGTGASIVQATNSTMIVKRIK